VRCAVLIEKAERNHSVCFPDRPGCMATGDTLEEVGQQIREAIAFHIQGPGEDGLPVAAPTPLPRPHPADIGLKFGDRRRAGDQVWPPNTR
jgi:predicted RNase H-like HicB family nuclease